MGYLQMKKEKKTQEVLITENVWRKTDNKIDGKC